MMMRSFVLFYCLILSTGRVNSLNAEEAVKRFFEYFKADELVGIPVARFEEPAQLVSPLDLVPISLINGSVFGHSKITIDQAMINMVTMTGSLKVKAPQIIVIGNYTWPGFFLTSKGIINATLLDIDAVVNVTMMIDESHTPLISDIELDLEYGNMNLNLTNLSWEQDLIVSTGSVKIFFYDIVLELFRQVKPLVIEMGNEEIRKFVKTLPPVVELLDNSISGKSTPDLKHFLQRLFQFVGMEPLHLPGRKSKMLGANFQVSNIILSGVSVITDIDNLLLLYHDKELYVEIKMTYPKLMLSYTLVVDYGLFLNFDTSEKNQLNNVVVRAKLIVDPKEAIPPQLKDFHLDIGSFGKVRNGKKGGILSLMGDFFHNLSDDVRSEIVSALSPRLKKILQGELNKVKLETTVIEFIKNKQLK